LELFGESYDRYFDLPEGTVGVMADLYSDGDTLILENVLIYPRDVDNLAIGVRGVLSIRRQIDAGARKLGFAKLRMTGIRLTGASPRRLVDVPRRLK
jgi:hypothetical protein